MSKVLVVEDDGVLAYFTKRLVESAGHTVVGSADTGESAIRLAREHHPDYILMDIRLIGQMSGVEAAKIILDESDVKVAFVTAHADAAAWDEIKKLSGTIVISKPLDIHRLRSFLDPAK